MTGPRRTRTRAVLALIAWTAPAGLLAAVTRAPEPWLKTGAECWSRLPQGQRPRLMTVLRSWPESVRRRAAAEAPSFPCNIVLAAHVANRAVHRHIQANPLPVNFNYDPANHKSWPGYQVDGQLRTMAAGAWEKVKPRSGTRRRDCIGMQIVAVDALHSAPSALRIEEAYLIIGNESLGRFPAKAAAYAVGANPVDTGVHHVAGFWPVLRGADTEGAVPDYAVILDYWPWQDAADPQNIKTKAEFEAEWDSLAREGALRRE